MRLYILPPAFGLPSVDAECNAAVAFLQLRLRDGFDIIPSHNPDQQLPCLEDGQTWSRGFNAIVRYLSAGDKFRQKASQTSKDPSDSLAIASFIELHAQTLLDISLYVSFENYRHVTRPAFTQVLPWYANYILPPRRRSAARSRTEHLGISSIDVDNVHDDMSNRPQGFDGVGKEQEVDVATQKRASLLLPRKETVRSLLKRPEHAAVFKLRTLAHNFFEPLQEVFASGKCFSVDEDLDAVDCLLYGYLSLMLFPKVPQDWLAQTLRQKYGKIASHIERVHKQLSLQTDAQAVSKLLSSKTLEEVEAVRASAKTSLLWSPPKDTSVLDAVQYVGNGIIRQLPLIGSPLALDLRGSPKLGFIHRHLSIVLLSLAGSSVGLGYIALHMGFLVWPQGQETHIFGRRRLSDYGHLGAALAGIGLTGPRI